MAQRLRLNDVGKHGYVLSLICDVPVELPLRPEVVLLRKQMVLNGLVLYSSHSCDLEEVHHLNDFMQLLCKGGND